MSATEAVVDRLKGVRWRRHAAVSPEARRLIKCHARLIRPVVRHLVSGGLPVAEAHGVALTPAHDAPEYGELYDALTEAIDFTDAVVSWPIVTTLVVAELWHLDPELARFPNPWTPLVELYRLGYPASYLDRPDQGAVDLTVFLEGGEEHFPTC